MARNKVGCGNCDVPDLQGARIPLEAEKSGHALHRVLLGVWRCYSPQGPHVRVLNGVLRLTLTSQYAKILHADRQPKGDSRSDRQARRMGCVPKRVVQDNQERRLEELCRRSEELEKLRRGRALCGVRYKPQQVQADRNDQIQMENGLHPAHPESR